MKRKYIIAVLFILAGILSYYLRHEETFSRSDMAMNTLIRMNIKAHDDSVLDYAFNLLHELDDSLSMYNPSSDISRINSNAGISNVIVPDYVADVIKKACSLYDMTDGVFNPLIGAVTRLWKINQKDGIIPSRESIDDAVKLTDIQNLVMNDKSVFLKHKGCVIDLGGIAKGYAGDMIAKVFRDKGIKSALIDLGGNICVIGNNFKGELWKVGIRDPFEPGTAPALVVHVLDANVITSGNYERFKIVDGKKFSHFFNPRTGESVMNDLLSVTVIDPDGALADGLATAFMAMGFNDARTLAQRLNVKAVLIRNDRTIHASESLRDTVSGNKFQIEFF